jgi:fructokinase
MAFLDACCESVKRLEREAGATCSVGVGVAGRMARDEGCVSANLPFLKGQNLRHDLSQRLGRDIRLANDANCAALAEAVDGAGAGHDSVLFLVMGTGVGSGFVHRGKIIDGPNGLTGEIGHLPLPFREAADGPVVPCGCKQQGCIDKSASGPALARLYEAMTGQAADARRIAGLARRGDAGALRVLDRFYEVAAKAMVAALHSFDPDIIVVGGGLGSLPGLCDETPKRWGRYCYIDNPKTKLVPAVHGAAAGARGAAWLWR